MTSLRSLSEFASSLPSLEAIRTEQRRRAELKRRQITELSTEATRERCRTLTGFIREAWHVAEPNEAYVHGWHIEAIAEHLEAITYGRLDPPRLLVNVPPGTMKSLMVNVFWPAWEWGPAGLPSTRYISTSYSEEYVTRDTRRMRDLVASEWYQGLWPSTKLVRFAETSFENASTGWREGKPFGSLTGGRGHRLLIDDPHSTETAESEAERKRTIRIFRESVPTRLADPATSAIVVIMQRLHAEDVSGVTLALRLGYTHLCLPMEFETDRRCRTSIDFVDPRTYEGELLFPERFPREVVERDKTAMGQFAVAGQFQQRPTLREGGLFKRTWFNPVGAAPAGTRWVRYWDLAATKDRAGADPAYTVGLKLGRAPNGRIVIDHVIRERDEGVGIRKLIKDTAVSDGYECEIGLPKDPGQAGKVQAQDLVLMLAGWIARATTESGDKGTRAAPIAAQAEAGNVDVVAGEWNEAFLDEVTNFPGGKFKDQVDALSGAFAMLIGAGIFAAPEAEIAAEPLASVPGVWTRVSAVVVDQGRVGVVWAAFNRIADIMHVVDEYAVQRGEMAVHAEAIRKRGAWIPALFELASGVRKDETTQIARNLADLGVDIYTVPLDEATGIEAIAGRIATKRLKVFTPMAEWFAEYRRYRRDEKGEVVQDGLLILATALVALHGADLAVTENEAMQSGPGYEDADYVQSGVSSTGY